MIGIEKGVGTMPLRKLAMVLAAAAVVGACDLDLQNPNAVTRDEVYSDLNGVIAAAVGMQDIYAANIADFVQAPALITDEWGTKSLSLLAWTAMLTGENFDNSYGTVEAPWAASYRVISVADDLLEGVGQVGFSPSFGSAIEALAHLYRGMALGQLYLHYERAPLDLDQDNPPAVPRAEILQEALNAFEAADQAWEAVDPAELGGFNARVKGSGLNVGATIDAMRARFSLFAGNYQNAMDAAEDVPAGVLSVFDYAGTDLNPIYDLSFGASYVAGLQSFVEEAEAGDQRPAFWLDLDADAPQSNTDTALVQFGQYSTPNDPFPVYLPDEMTLIRAEAHARMGNYPEARDLVNEVRTDCDAITGEPDACLDALPEAELDTEAELLDQIAYERAYELYSQGLRWEDARRLEDYVEASMWLRFLPIPIQECLANTSIEC